MGCMVRVGCVWDMGYGICRVNVWSLWLGLSSRGCEVGSWELGGGGGVERGKRGVESLRNANVKKKKKNNPFDCYCYQ